MNIMTKSQYLKAIRANPDDLAARIDYANFLDKHVEEGQPELKERHKEMLQQLLPGAKSAEAAYIRLMTEAEGLPDTDPDKAAMLECKKTLEQYTLDWERPLSIALDNSIFEVEYDRGIPSQIALNPTAFRSHGEKIQDVSPAIDRLKIRDLSSLVVEDFVTSKHLDRYRSLDLSIGRPSSQATTVQISTSYDKAGRFAGFGGTDLSAHTRGQIPRESLRDADARLIAECPYLKNLENLNLANHHFGREGLQALANSPHFADDMQITVGELPTMRFAEFVRIEREQRLINSEAGTGRGRAGNSDPRQTQTRDNNPDTGNEG